MQKSRSCGDVLQAKAAASAADAAAETVVEETAGKDDEEEDDEENGQSASGEEGQVESSGSGDSSTDDSDGSGSDSDSNEEVKDDADGASDRPDADKGREAAFFIDFGDSVATPAAPAARPGALQKSFETFLRRKKRDLKLDRKSRCGSLASSPDRMWALRMKFLERCKHYFGVPYKRKYWTEADPEYSSSLFLDCCGLVRRVLYDLRREFGFKIGPWNQAYMFDTLPLRLTEDAMQPGDLVFIEAVYYSDTAKKQRHNMVHVEVWLGEGSKTIGARWQKGKVQVFDSYRFVSTSYHSQVHHFCSIDTWLRGVCRSFCPEHPWRRYTGASRANKYSIFKADQQKSDSSAAGHQSKKKSRHGKKLKKKRRRRRRKLQQLQDSGTGQRTRATAQAASSASLTQSASGSGSALRSIASLPEL